MVKAILGKKLGMTQVFDEVGKVIPVTVIEAGPCVVVQKKTQETDGYNAIQVGFEDKAERKLTKPAKGHFNKAGVAYKAHLKEFRLEDTDTVNVGDVIKADVFAAGEKVDVTGMTKGRGFTGTVKRWGTHRGPMSHGSGYHRGVGSMGSNSDPSRVFKGKRLPGQYGNEKVTIQNLDVVKVDTERNLLLVKGAIPGAKGGLLVIKNTVKSGK